MQLTRCASAALRLRPAAPCPGAPASTAVPTLLSCPRATGLGAAGEIDWP